MGKSLLVYQELEENIWVQSRKSMPVIMLTKTNLNGMPLVQHVDLTTYY